ncbi:MULTISPECIES: hypothetical protein [unclassified Caballeronia]|uniref:hypothetical protein n=1 Tax=unclassified Caballeronia TaxID=2646786 RepID=UPI0020289411|nr:MULTISPECIES: hypothetical protein [unclassified Caballeronia]
MSAFTNRCLMNWIPIATKIRASGGTCNFLLFPRLSDPDHKGLYSHEIQSHAVLTAPIDASFELCETTEADCKAAIQHIVKRKRYDGVLMTTCHLGPELTLRSWVQAVSPATQFVGLQHGFVQQWPNFEARFSSYDYLGVFGRAFRHRLVPEFRKRTVALSLPILDSYASNARPEGNRILFALQRDISPGEVQRLAQDIEILSGRKMVLRAHPEHVSHYDVLRPTFEFSDPAEPLSRALARTSAVITSGSTLALASLAMKRPTAILRHLGGEEYEPFGIVADAMEAEPILQILDRFREPSFWPGMDEILENYAGRAGRRVDDAYETLGTLFVRSKMDAKNAAKTINGWFRRVVGGFSA